MYRRAGKVAPPDIAAPAAYSKYNARKKEVGGILFDSSGEAEAYCVLSRWQAMGAITGLELQPRFVLQVKAKGRRAIEYVADFRYWDVARKITVTADFKGFQTPVFKIKRKLFAERYPDAVLEIWTRATLKEMSRR